jgi:hypothetical protein
VIRGCWCVNLEDVTWVSVKYMNNCEVGFNRTHFFLTFKITWIRSVHLLIIYFLCFSWNIVLSWSVVLWTSNLAIYCFTCNLMLKFDIYPNHKMEKKHHVNEHVSFKNASSASQLVISRAAVLYLCPIVKGQSGKWSRSC